ncbi:MAG: family 43 glycosylhydrolase [Oscillospiraceae bacterium]|nr:family 43 glycosylhydrolase [Oscillospiraceae bacterium]
MKHKNKLCTAVLALTLAVTGLTAAVPQQRASAAAGTRVSVHDPSIIKTNGTYYVFGSHIDAAKSTNLRDWTRFSNGYARTNNVEFGNLSQNLAKAFAWAGEDLGDCKGGFAVWAPDVYYNPDYVNANGTKGAYLMYFCTSSDYRTSVIAYAASQNVEGPYTFVDTLIYSGFTDTNIYWEGTDRSRRYNNTNIQELIDKGEVTFNSNWFSNHYFNNQQYPNAIDPTIYTDTDGRMYMCYGSWSGGIFSLEIDKATGRCIHPKTGTTSDGRMVDSYFGTKISGGWGKSGEGPFIEYNADTGYYYLWVTYGGLFSTGGYNMRVGRSRSPQGPFVDPAGRNMVLESNTNLDSIGLKVMGNYKFSSTTPAYMACGHNSVLRDDDGEWYLFYHARFDDGGEGHEVRVHSMKFNEAGWPVVIPFEYCVKPWSETGYLTEDIAGTYEFINHGNGTDGNIINYQNVTLNADGTVSGAVTGTWQQSEETAAATLRLNNVTYQGYFAAEYDEATGKRVMVFTAVCSNNQTVWGAQTKAWSGIERTVTPITYADGKYITGLTVGDKSTARSWSVETAGKGVGSTVFGDRAFTFTAIPEALADAEWITTACDAKKYAGEEASFTAGDDTTVYVALDTRVTDIPAWLSAWEKTDGTLTDDGDPQVIYQLYKRDFAAGETVTLGALNQTSCVNYTVAAAAQKKAPVIGDINADGVCDLTDLVMMHKYLMKTGDLTPEQGAVADMNTDGKINAKDLTLLKRILLNT